MSFDIQSVRHHIDNRITTLLTHQQEPTPTNTTNSPMMTAVYQQAQHSSKGGKRLRALLEIQAATATNPHPTTTWKQHILDLGCAIEIFQTGALIHDDLIDDSNLRRGMPAAHCALAHYDMSQQADHKTGNDLALLLGDYLATLSALIIAEEQNSTLGSDLLFTFLMMQKEVEIGQVLDAANEFISLDDPQRMTDNCFSIFEKKTASYTTIAPLQLGFLMSDIPRQDALYWGKKIGLPLGLAFQIADDLLDIDSSDTGKPSYKDITSGKRSILLATALQMGDQSCQERLKQLYTIRPLTPQIINEIATLFMTSGAVDYLHQRIRFYWEETQKQLAEFQQYYPLDDAARDDFITTMALFIPSVDR